ARHHDALPREWTAAPAATDDRLRRPGRPLPLESGGLGIPAHSRLLAGRGASPLWFPSQAGGRHGRHRVAVLRARGSGAPGGSPHPPFNGTRVARGRLEAGSRGGASRPARIPYPDSGGSAHHPHPGIHGGRGAGVRGLHRGRRGASRPGELCPGRAGRPVAMLVANLLLAFAWAALQAELTLAHLFVGYVLGYLILL